VKKYYVKIDIVRNCYRKGVVNLKTRILLFLISLLLLCNAVNGEEFYSFTDDFNSPDKTVYSGTNVLLDDNWASKTYGTMDGDGTDVTTFGFSGESLVVNTFKQDTYPKISNAQLTRIPGFNWTADHYKLSPSFELNLNVTKSHDVNMWGIKFMQHNNEKNYYLLFFGGKYSYQLTSGLVSWGLYKVTDGNVTILKEQLQGENSYKKYIGTKSEAKLNLSYDKGDITFNVEYNGDENFYSGSYKDENPYILNGNESGIQLLASSCGNSAYPIYFNSFSITDKQGIYKDSLYKFYESFGNKNSAVLSGTNVILDDSWSSKSTGTMNGDGTGTTTFYFNGEGLVVNTFKQETYPKISSSQLSKMPGFNWTASHDELDGNIKITASVTKSHNVNMWGIKFMQHNNEKNYYFLFFGGQYSYQLTSGLVSWGLYKVADGNVTKLKEMLQSEDTSKKYIGTKTDAKLNLWYNNGEISFKVEYDGDENYYTGSYKDDNPYILKGNESGVQLVASSCGNSAYPIYFNDFTVESYIPYITDGEPDNVIYIEVPAEKENKAADFKSSKYIKKLIYSGDIENDVIYASKDGKNYVKLAYLSDFKDGVWINTSTAEKFRYIMFSDIENLKIYESISDYWLSVDSSPLKMFSRVNGVDTTDDILSGDSFILDIKNNILTPMGIGSASLIGGNSSAVINVTNDKMYYSSNNILADSDNKIYTGNGVCFEEFRSKLSAEGNMGKNNDALFGTVNKKLRVYGSSNSESYDYNIQYGLNSNHLYYPAIICENEIQGETTINLSFKKSHSSQTVGIKLLDGQENGAAYTLWFPGMNSYGSTWMIYKEQDGVASCVAQGDTITDNSAGDKGYVADGESNLKIDIADNTISFILDYDGMYSIKGKYTEKSGITPGGAVWLMAGAKASNPLTDKRYVDFYDVRFSSYNDRENEKESVLYYDAAYGRNLIDGIIDLGESCYISRIDIENNSADTVVSVSSDNKRYYNVTKEDIYNSYFTDKYRYIKISGGDCHIKVLADAGLNSVKSHIGDTIMFYPYLNGEYSEADSWETSSSAVSIDGGAVWSDNLVKFAVITALCGGEEISAKISFDYLDYDLNRDGNIYTFDIPALSGESATAVIAWYGADGTMKAINNYDIVFDGHGRASLSLNKIYGAGAYGKVFVMRSLDNTLPLTAVKIIY